MSDKIAIFVSGKQQVNDIAAALRSLTSQLELMQRTIDSQHAEICTLNHNVDRLLKENRELRKRLEKYEKPPKDSGNSSTPPSKEPIKSEVERRTRSLRKKSDKAVGGQPGHEGTTRKMVETPDEIENIASQFCSGCGRDLSDVEGELDYVMQEIDLPPITAIYRERRFYKKVCACGCCNRDYAPLRRVGNAIMFGKNIRAVATYLSVVQCMPYERLQSCHQIGKPRNIVSTLVKSMSIGVIAGRGDWSRCSRVHREVSLVQSTSADE